MGTDQSSAGYSIAWLSDYFLRSPSWVKQRKNDLREIWYWCHEDLFNESGSLTDKGFEKLQDLFDKTANSRIITLVSGKKQSKAKKPTMTPGEYRQHIWAKHRKLPPDADPPIDTAYANNHANDQEIEVIEVELDPQDAAAEIAENAAIVKHDVKRSNEHNRQQFQGGLSRLKSTFKERIKQELSPVFQEAMSEVYDELLTEITEEAPQATQQSVKKTRRKVKRSDS
jgi:hypothetical protein